MIIDNTFFISGSSISMETRRFVFGGNQHFPNNPFGGKQI